MSCLRPTRDTPNSRGPEQNTRQPATRLPKQRIVQTVSLPPGYLTMRTAVVSSVSIRIAGGVLVALGVPGDRRYKDSGLRTVWLGWHVWVYWFVFGLSTVLVGMSPHRGV